MNYIQKFGAIIAIIGIWIQSSPAQFLQFPSQSKRIVIPHSSPVPTYVSSVATATDGVFSIAITPANTNDLLIVLYIGSSNALPTTISDTAGNTWTNWTVGVYNDLTYTTWVYDAWTAQSKGTSATTISVASSAYHGGIMVGDYKNSSGIDAIVQAGSSSYSSAVTGTLTLSNANDIVIGFGKGAGGTPTVAGTGFTLRQHINTDTSTFFEDKTAGSTSTTASTSTGTPNNPWYIFGIGLKP